VFGDWIEGAKRGEVLICRDKTTTERNYGVCGDIGNALT